MKITVNDRDISFKITFIGEAPQKKHVTYKILTGNVSDYELEKIQDAIEDIVNNEH